MCRDYRSFGTAFDAAWLRIVDAGGGKPERYLSCQTYRSTVSWLMLSKPSRFNRPDICSGLQFCLRSSPTWLNRAYQIGGFGVIGCAGRPVVSIPPRAIAPNLSRNRAPMAVQLPRDLGLSAPLLSQGGQHISLPGGELVIRHGCYPCSWRNDETPSIPAHLSFFDRVALSL
jgi:hypothetical protein